MQSVHRFPFYNDLQGQLPQFVNFYILMNKWVVPVRLLIAYKLPPQKGNFCRPLKETLGNEGWGYWGGATVAHSRSATVVFVNTFNSFCPALITMSTHKVLWSLDPCFLPPMSDISSRWGMSRDTWTSPIQPSVPSWLCSGFENAIPYLESAECHLNQNQLGWFWFFVSRL